MTATETFWQSPRKIFVVVDNDSWILPYARQLVTEVRQRFNDDVRLCRSHNEIGKGTAAFYLGCVRLTEASVRHRNHYNLVVHESNLPAGRGFAPLQWQILEGRNEIPVCLFEATDEVDAGPVYLRDCLRFEGHELNDQLRDAQGRMTISLVLRFLASPGPPQGEPQAGTPTYYRRRTPQDSALDVDRPIADQFDLLRVVDNERYPAFFEARGRTYVVKIYPKDDD